MGGRAGSSRDTDDVIAVTGDLDPAVSIFLRSGYRAASGGDCKQFGLGGSGGRAVLAEVTSD